MTNHEGTYTSSEDIEHLFSETIRNKKNMYGGDSDNNNSNNDKNDKNDKNDNNDRPTGGFPPIYIISQKEETEQKATTKREFKTSNNPTVSIRDILASKRE
jgi:hypothetical protein